MYDDPLVLDWPHPDPVDVVVDLAGMMARVAAERLLRIDQLRLAYLADAEVAGRVLTDVVLRGLRLELAAAMRITEYAAGNLIALAEALVQRYPEVMTALSDARITERHAEILVDGLDESSLTCAVTCWAKPSCGPNPSRSVYSVVRCGSW